MTQGSSWENSRCAWALVVVFTAMTIMGTAAAAITLTGTVTNSITKNPVVGASVLATLPSTKAIAPAITGADGKYTIEVPDGTGALVFTVSCSEYKPQIVDIPDLAAKPLLDVSLEPMDVATPRLPIAISGPKCVFLEWYANPEYNLKGYSVWRTETDKDGLIAKGATAVKVSDLLTGTEYSDTSAVKDLYYKYQIQAISGADRPSELSPLSEPAVMAGYVTVFTTDQDVPDGLANLYLEDFTPEDATDNPWVRIPICARSSYNVSTLGMAIHIDLPKDLLNVTREDVDMGKIKVEPTGITAGMNMVSAVNEEGKLIIVADDLDERNLYGSGVLFDVFVQKKGLAGSGTLQLVQDTFNPGPPPSGRAGVRFCDDANPPAPIGLVVESGTLYTTKRTCPMLGDVNGDTHIDAADVDMMGQLCSGNTPFQECTLRTADINLDKRVDQADMILLQRWVDGLPLNPPPTWPMKSTGESSSFALMDTKAGPPEVWVDPVSDEATAGSNVTASVTISGAAPLAGCSITVNFLAGPQGLAFTSAALANGLPTSFRIASKDNSSGERGSVAVVVSGTIPTAKSTDTQLVRLTFKVGEQHTVAGPLPVTLGAFEVTDEFGFTPRHGAPGQPIRPCKSTGKCVEFFVPGVVGLTEPAATTAITAAGLTMGTVTVQSSGTVAAGLVISQYPAANTWVSPFTEVDLVVSDGPACKSAGKCADSFVPDVVGLTQSAAGAVLTGTGFILGTVTQQCNPGMAAGLVISQNPAAGTQAAGGSAVTLMISTGPCGAEGEGEGEGETTAPTEADLRALLQSSFTTVDTDGNDTISYSEALAALPGLTQAVFDSVNTSGTGEISHAELIGPHLPPDGCKGCSGSKGASAVDQVKEALGSLFMGGLSLMALLAFGKRRP